MISLEQYAFVLALSIIALMIVTFCGIVATLVSASLRKKLAAIPTKIYFLAIALFSTASTLGAFVFQYGYDLLPCEMCWWQRIFIIPIIFVAWISWIKNIRANTIIIVLLSLCGLFWAGYQLFLQYSLLFFATTSLAPCSVGGFLPSCSGTDGVQVFGFVTIPFMSVIFLITTIWLSWLASRAKV